MIYRPRVLLSKRHRAEGVHRQELGLQHNEAIHDHHLLEGEAEDAVTLSFAMQAAKLYGQYEKVSYQFLD